MSPGNQVEVRANFSIFFWFFCIWGGVSASSPPPKGLLKCLSSCLSPPIEGLHSPFKGTPAVRIMARQLSNKHWSHGNFRLGKLSGPLQLRVQSLLRTRVRIAASIVFLFRAYLKKGFGHSCTTIARLSFLGGLEQGSRELLPVCGHAR